MYVPYSVFILVYLSFSFIAGFIIDYKPMMRISSCICLCPLEPLLKDSVVVYVDETFLAVKVKGTLFMACTTNANTHIFPLALGIGDTENDDSWT